MPRETYARIYAVVRKIPKGRVMSYGAVAWRAGRSRNARQVGYAMHALPDQTTVPWHRVVNAKGMVSTRRTGAGELLQRIILEREGVVFDSRGRIDLKRYAFPRQ
jgi:methylated-DNA-protein-cysteine methyltransferase related protein